MDNYEREIDLRQLLILIAMQWRVIVLVAAVCAFIGSVHQFNSNQRTARAVVDLVKDGETPEDIYQYKLNLYKYIKDIYRGEIDNYRDMISRQQEYLNKSLRMVYDPASMVAAEVRLEFDEHVDVEDVLNSWRDAIKTDAFWTKFAEQRGVEPKYLREIVWHSRTTAREITLGAVSGDAQLTEDLLSQLLTAVPEKPRKETRIAPYATADADVMEWRRDQRSAMLSLVNMLTAAYNNYDRLQEPKKPVQRGRKVASSSGRAFVKGGILGCMAGVFAICILMALRLVMGGRVLSPGEFFGKYQYNCLAILPPRPRRRKMLAADKLLLRWSDSSRFGKLGEAERFEVAAENIRHRIKEGAPLLLLGTVDARALDAVRTALSKGLPDSAISTRQFIDQQLPVMHDIDTHEHIVLVEKLYCSKYRDIDHEAQTIAERHKEVVGCILV